MIEFYGASDDLITCEGQVDEEWSDPRFGAEEGGYVYTSTGAAVRMRLHDEGWRAQVVAEGDVPPRIEFFRKSGPTDRDDHVFIDGDVEWVIAVPIGPALASG